MQVSVETTSGLERRLTIGVPAAEIDSAVQEKLSEAAKRVRLDGFRPGKVPLKEVKKRFGASVRAEVIGDAIQRTYYQALSQEKLKPAGMPRIEPKKDEAGADLEYVAIFEVYPEIEVNGLEAIKVEKPHATISDSDINEMIDLLRTQRKEWKDKEGEATVGDQVVIDYEGTKDGELFEGGSAKGTTLELGSNKMIPGFEDGLVGAKAGEARVLNLTFPEAYHNESLKGQPVLFNVSIQQVKSSALPELNEDFFEIFGVKEGGIEKFRDEISKNMERELKNAVKNRVKTQVMDGVLENNQIEVPASLVRAEIDRQRQAMFRQFGGGQGLDPKMLPDELFQEKAERSVKLGLVLSEIISTTKLKPDAARVREYIEEMASTYENPQAIVEYYYSNEEQLQQIQSVVLEEQVVDAILRKALVTEKQCTYQEVLNPKSAAENITD